MYYNGPWHKITELSDRATKCPKQKGLT